MHAEYSVELLTVPHPEQMGVKATSKQLEDSHSSNDTELKYTGSHRIHWLNKQKTMMKRSKTQLPPLVVAPAAEVWGTGGDWVSTAVVPSLDFVGPLWSIFEKFT